MRSALVAVAALACVCGADAALRGQAATTPTRAMVNVYRASQAGVGPLIGEVTVQDSNRGLLLHPNLVGLPPGRYGFFVHENGDCGPKKADGVIRAAGKSGSVLDERAAHSNAVYGASVSQHMGPTSVGFVGDLPVLEFDHSQTFNRPVVAPRLRLTDILGRSLVVMDTARPDKHKNAMNLACGVVPQMSVGLDNSLALGLSQ